MSNIVQLKDFSGRRPSSERPEGSAQILFFLGVRYCRREEDAGGHPDDDRIGPRLRAPRRAARRKRA